MTTSASKLVSKVRTVAIRFKKMSLRHYDLLNYLLDVECYRDAEDTLGFCTCGVG